MITSKAVEHLKSMNALKEQFVNPKLLEGESVHIFNTFDKEHRMILGGLGSYCIPACKPGQEYAELVVPFAVVDRYWEGETRAANVVTGLDLANDIVGVGKKPEDDLRHWGVFVGSASKPTAAELRSARENLTRLMNGLVNEANRLFSGNTADRDSIGEKHRKAAEFTKQKLPWLTLSTALDECPFCGESHKPGLAFCPHCDSVLDEAKARKGKPWLFDGKKAS